MVCNGDEGKFIPVQEGAEMTEAWRDGGNGPINGGLFGIDNMNELLQRPEVKGMRYYFGIQPQSGEKTIVLVGVDAHGNDILDRVLEWSLKCPPVCGSGGLLNGGE